MFVCICLRAWYLFFISFRLSFPTNPNPALTIRHINPCLNPTQHTHQRVRPPQHGAGAERDPPGTRATAGGAARGGGGGGRRGPSPAGAAGGGAAVRVTSGFDFFGCIDIFQCIHKSNSTVHVLIRHHHHYLTHKHHHHRAKDALLLDMADIRRHGKQQLRDLLEELRGFDRWV